MFGYEVRLQLVKVGLNYHPENVDFTKNSRLILQLKSMSYSNRKTPLHLIFKSPTEDLGQLIRKLAFCPRNGNSN